MDEFINKMNCNMLAKRKAFINESQCKYLEEKLWQSECQWDSHQLTFTQPNSILLPNSKFWEEWCATQKLTPSIQVGLYPNKGFTSLVIMFVLILQLSHDIVKPQLSQWLRAPNWEMPGYLVEGRT